MLKLQSDLFATDKNDNEVFMAKGDTISEISDAGPMDAVISAAYLYGTNRKVAFHEVPGWNVTVRFTPSHKQWTELVTVDAVKLLRALAGE